MGNTQSSQHTCIDWLAKGPLAPHVDAYKQYLTVRGYAATTFANCIRSITHFAQWIHGRRLPLRRIDEAAIAEFLDDHLLRCRCTGQIQRDRRSLSAALGHLLSVLRAQGAVAPPTARTTPVIEELRRYDEHMDHVRGLAPKTRSIALRIVGRLLASRFGSGAVNIAAIKPDHVRRFFVQQAKLYSKPVNAGTVVATLRGYALATVGRAIQHHRAVARTREHEYYPSIRRSRLGDEGKGTRQTGSTRHQVATIPCARLAHEVSSDAVTMQRMRRHLMSGAAGPARSSRHNYA